jgi:penicillin-binding protein 1A
MKPTDALVDAPVTINGWTPRNSTRTNAGSVTLREAFSRSINTISAKIGQQLGFSTIADMARRFGITGEISTFPSMVLGTSDVRLIDMTRAFASVSNKGVAVTPYAIRKVVAGDGRLLYQHERLEERVLVAPWVAAEMTDLLQSAVLSGTGRAAQIGRPVAGKTGTTSSNKDGWFIGFSSGLTTGVWMGRDDARPIAGLQGGTAPARAFHDFMVVAVARRPIEQFETKVPQPNWELDPEEELWGAPLDGNGTQPAFDAEGNPIYSEQALDDGWQQQAEQERPFGEQMLPGQTVPGDPRQEPQPQPPQRQPNALPRPVQPAPEPLEPLSDETQ